MKRLAFLTLLAVGFLLLLLLTSFGPKPVLTYDTETYRDTVGSDKLYNKRICSTMTQVRL